MTQQHTARLRAPADFGMAIRQSRLARGLTQQQLAEALGIPHSTVSEIEAGKSTIYLRRLLRLAKRDRPRDLSQLGRSDASRLTPE